ncbi:MAG: hypothetical protein HPY61_07310 [Methanotrichaceae archaeon]|nr:hypothetical protein [Methanotrichaceae archaeon]
MEKEELSIAEIGSRLAEAVNMKTWPLCAYGSDWLPGKVIPSSSISECLASAVYHLADGRITDPVYIRHETGRSFCRCIGGPAWFGYCGFDPRLPGLMATTSPDENLAPKRLKADETVARETYDAVGDIKPMGRYVVIGRCEGMADDPGVRCIICFAGGEQIRDLCALAHFGSPDAINSISAPWGPACATLITYPAGMAENASVSKIYLGPTDPSARQWLPESCLAMGIPVKIARRMAGDAGASFLVKSD